MDSLGSTARIQLTQWIVPEAEDVKRLKSLVEDDSTEAETLLKPSKNSVSISNVLFCANQIFTTEAPNFSSRRLFIVTDNDNPHAMDKALRSAAAVRAKDLYDLGVVLELFPISSSSHTFNRKLFYDDIIYRASPSDPNAPAYNPSALSSTDTVDFKSGSQDGVSLLQSLLSGIASKSTPHRTLFASVPLELAPGLRISVKGYLLYKRQTPARSTYIYLGADKPLIAKGSTKQVTDKSAGADKPLIAESSTTQQADDSMRTVEKPEIRKAYSFGGEQVVFTRDEIKQLRNFGDPIIRTIGFKPIKMLPMWANYKHATFLYPSEDDFVGSTRVFSALYQKLVRSKLMALTWFIARRNASPVIAAIVPTQSTPASDSDQNLAGFSSSGCPQGLHLIPLPFADDIRQNPAMPHAEPLRATDELTDKMQKVIMQLSLPKGTYDPGKYPNPALQWHYRILQALALDEDLPEKGEDKTKPKYKQIDKRVGNEVTEWGVELENAHRKHQAENSNAGASSLTKKRPANGDGDGAAPKKVKTEPGEVVSQDQMKKLWEKQQLGNLKVQQLKDWCGAKGLPVGGKKNELIEKVEAWFETN